MPVCGVPDNLYVGRQYTAVGDLRSMLKEASAAKFDFVVVDFRLHHLAMAAMVALHLSRSLVFFAYLSSADETKSSLGIRTGSKLEEVFEQSDVDGNNVLQNDEETAFETQIQSAISDYWFMAPFEVTLYASDDCTGASSVATASSEETRCKQCFDVCGKAFSDSSSMAIADPLREGGYASLVRSLRVQKGAVHVSNFFCFGRYNFGFNATSGGRVVDEKDGCINFKEPAHLSAVDPVVLQTVTLYFLKEDLTVHHFLKQGKRHQNRTFPGKVI
eukprot:symbB.v1.2.024971.t1/scaffold2401.1/size80084/3